MYNVCFLWITNNCNLILSYLLLETKSRVKLVAQFSLLKHKFWSFKNSEDSDIWLQIKVPDLGWKDENKEHA